MRGQSYDISASPPSIDCSANRDVPKIGTPIANVPWKGSRQDFHKDISGDFFGIGDVSQDSHRRMHDHSAMFGNDALLICGHGRDLRPWNSAPLLHCRTSSPEITSHSGTISEILSLHELTMINGCSPHLLHHSARDVREWLQSFS